MSQTLNFVPTFYGTNYSYWKARMRFFLKSIDVWKIIEFGWIKLEDTTDELKPAHNFPTIKLSMLYVMRFHHLNSQEFQTMNPLKKRDKS